MWKIIFYSRIECGMEKGKIKYWNSFFFSFLFSFCKHNFSVMLVVFYNNFSVYHHLLLTSIRSSSIIFFHANCFMVSINMNRKKNQKKRERDKWMNEWRKNWYNSSILLSIQSVQLWDQHWRKRREKNICFMLAFIYLLCCLFSCYTFPFSLYGYKYCRIILSTLCCARLFY